MINLPNLKHLQYLIALHKHQHFKQAAVACDVSQSTLSAAIAQLEEQLNCALIERKHKGFNFTPVGEQVIRDAKMLVQSATDLIQFTSSHNQPMTGNLVLGCIPTIAPFVLSNIVKDTSIQFPNLKLLLLEETTSNLIEALSFGDVDMAIVALPYKTEGFCEVVLAEEPLNLVMHKQAYETSGGDIAKLADGSVVLLHQDHCLSGHCKGQFKKLTPAKINRFFATSITTMIQMAEAAKSATIIPQMALNANILAGTGLQVVHGNVPNATRKVALLWRQSNKRLALYQPLIGVISEVVRTKCLKNHPF